MTRKLVARNERYFAELEELLAVGERVQIRVKGYSMRPWLRNDRQRVVLRPCSDEEMRKGEIVLFRYRGRHILHRIVRREGDRLTLAGDGNYRQQEHCTVRDVVAIAETILSPRGKETRCDSFVWRFKSRLWLGVPALLRRYILAALARLGYK